MTMPGVGELEAHHALFSESASRALVVPRAGNGSALEEMAAAHQVPIEYVGVTGGSDLVFSGLFQLPLSDAIVVYEAAVPKLMSASRVPG